MELRVEEICKGFKHCTVNGVGAMGSLTVFGLVTGMMHSYLETRSGVGLWWALHQGLD